MNNVKPPNNQKKYRQRQSHRGLVRYELQVTAKSKEQFEEIVEAAAAEYMEPWDIRRRLAKARASIFDELTQGIKHEFFVLKDQIQALKSEIKALSPSFFTKDLSETPVPEAIKELPDDTSQLKRIIAKLHKEAQQSKKEVIELKRRSEQYRTLYETVNAYNDELRLNMTNKKCDLHE